MPQDLIAPGFDSEPRCAGSGYLVKGLPSRVCPECGSDLRRVGVTVNEEPHRVRAGRLLGAAVVLFVVLVFLLPLPAGPRFAVSALVSVVSLAGALVWSGLVRFRGWGALLLLAAMPLSFPAFLLTPAWEGIAGRGDRAAEPTALAHVLLGVTATLLAFSWVKVMRIVEARGGVTFPSVAATYVVLPAEINAWAIFTLCDVTVFLGRHLVASADGKQVAAVVSPDGRHKAVAYRHDGPEPTYTVHVQPNSHVALRRRNLGLTSFTGSASFDLRWSQDAFYTRLFCGRQLIWTWDRNEEQGV